MVKIAEFLHNALKDRDGQVLDVGMLHVDGYRGVQIPGLFKNRP